MTTPTAVRQILLILLALSPTLGAVEPLMAPQPPPEGAPNLGPREDELCRYEVTRTPGSIRTKILGRYANNSGSQRLTGFRHIPDPYGRTFYDQYVAIYSFTPSDFRITPSAMYTPDVSTTCIGSIWGVVSSTFLDFLLNGFTFPLQCTQTLSLPFGEQADLVITYETEDFHVKVFEKLTGYVISTMDVKGVLKRGTVPVPSWENIMIINRIGEDGLPVNPFHNTTQGGMLPPPPGPMWSSG